MVQHNLEMTAAATKDLNDFAGRGLEIAPYFDPFVDRSKHAVLYTDYIPHDEIKRKASENPSLNAADIPDIDFVWTPGQPLSLCAPVEKFDYVVASHVLEHVPNPIGWLNDVLSVVKTSGKVVIFLPDRRVNADLHRSLTTFAELIDLWIQQPDVPTPRQVADFMGGSFLNEHGSNNFYGVGQAKTVVRSYPDSEAIDVATFVARNGNYVDVHASVWEPDHFCELVNRLVAAGLLNVKISALVTDTAEFMVVLVKLGEPERRAPAKAIAHQKSDTLDHIRHRLEVMHHESGHMQRALFNDLTFLIARNNEMQAQVIEMQRTLDTLAHQKGLVERAFTRVTKTMRGSGKP